MKQMLRIVRQWRKLFGAASVLAAVTAFIVSSMFGCGSARRGVPHSTPVDLSNPSVAHGQQVFMAYCNQCHPGGAAGLAPALNDKPLPAGLIKFQVRHGLGAMPAFDEKHIPDADLDDLVAYLKALREAK